MKKKSKEKNEEKKVKYKKSWKIVMEQYILAAAVAAIAPSLLVKGVLMTLSGGWNLGKRAIYGKQKTHEEIIIELLEREIKEERERANKIELKLDEILKHNYIQTENKINEQIKEQIKK